MALIHRASNSTKAQESFDIAKEQEDTFRKMLPQSGFFYDYMRYTDRQESPDSYHFWVAATILAAVLERQCWVPKGVYKVYPNLYTILVSASGRCRKSRAIAMGMKLIEDMSFVNILADKTTPEALVDALDGKKTVTGGRTITQADSTGFIQANEFAVFINKQQYNQAMVPLLTSLFDNPDSWKYKTKSGGTVHLKNVSLSMLGGSTPEWLASDLPDNAFEGGFMSRIIFIVRQDRNRIIPWPEEPPQAEIDGLKAQLVRMRRDCIGGIGLDERAMAWFNNWYNSAELRPSADYQLTGFVERKPDLVLKMALLLAVSQGRSTIDIADMRMAYDITSWTQTFMFTAFKNVGMSQLGMLASSIMKIVQAEGGTASRALVARRLAYQLQNGRQDLDNAVEILQMSGQIKQMQGESKKTGPKPLFYVATEPPKDGEDGKA
jgi:hypothetical protein